MRKSGRTRGLTVTEILIAIAVITIAMMGTIAAIAFGLRAAHVGNEDTVAVSINRKVTELILQNQFQVTSGLFAHGPADENVARGTAPWQPLYQTGGVPAGWFSLADYGFTEGTADAQKFIRDTQGFELDVSCQQSSGGTTNPNLSVSRAFYLITVTTRWQNKQRWRSLRTEAFSTSVGY